MGGDELIRLSDLGKRFEIGGSPIDAVSNIALNVKEGEFVTLIGPSGCGKTTILRIIAGLDKPSAGEATFRGANITGCGQERCMVFQEHALFPWRSVEKNIEFGLEIKGIEKGERKRIAAEYMELTGLGNFANAAPHMLSGGMKQRVGLARALACEPAVLLMDEPFGSLDAQTRNMMQKELLSIWEKTKKTVVFVTHSVDEAIYLSDRIVLLTAQPGKIKNVFDVSMDRPRNRNSREATDLRARILSELESEAENARREESSRASGSLLIK